MFSTGGVGDIFLMEGENPQEILKKYHSIIGIPVLLP